MRLTLCSEHRQLPGALCTVFPVSKQPCKVGTVVKQPKVTKLGETSKATIFPLYRATLLF